MGKNSDNDIIVLTDTEFKSNAAYSFLKELQRETYKEVPQFQSEHDTISSLSSMKGAVLQMMG